MNNRCCRFLGFCLLVALGCLVAACGNPSGYPAGQAEFVKIIDDAFMLYTNGTSAQKEGVVDTRQTALVDFINKGAHFTDWVAEVQDVALEGNTVLGKALTGQTIAVVTVTFDRITLRNTNLFLSENSLENAIVESSVLFSQATALQKGQKVLVSGYFMLNSKGAPREMNLLDSKSMTHPEYVVAFTAIKPQK